VSSSSSSGSDEEVGVDYEGGGKSGSDSPETVMSEEDDVSTIISRASLTPWFLLLFLLVNGHQDLMHMLK